MNYLHNVAIDIYSMTILCFLTYHTMKTAERKNIQTLLYASMLFATFIMLSADLFSWFDGHTGSPFVQFNHIGNFVMFAMQTVLPSLHVLYIQHQVFHENKWKARLVLPLVGVFLINLSLLVLTQFNGWYYSIDAANVYHRGPHYLVAMSFFFLLLFAATLTAVVYRRHIEKKIFASLIVFPLPPAICVVLQYVFYGTSLILHGVTLSLLILFFSMQNRNLHIDYLTGVYNRKKLESFLKEKINESTETRTFSAIMIDLDDFKYINDTFGHDVGDQALEASTRLLKSCLRTDDLIARFGGDEFYVILDISSLEVLEAAVDRIRKGLVEYNAHHSNPFTLGFSMGYDIYDWNLRMKSEEFQKHIDILMYQEKMKKKIVEK